MKDAMTPTLVSKIVTLLHYCDMERRGVLSHNAASVRNMMLDDPEVAEWMHAHRNDIRYNVRNPK